MGNYFKRMSNKVRDESFSMDLPGSNLVLTRYLYLKDEVKLALLVSILNKSDDAIFWAYELYYSGFKLELYDYIWKIYYDFFATLNPSFELYLHKTLKNPNDLIENAKLVSTIVQNLLIRPFNTDVFFLRTICDMFEIECKLVNPKYDISKLNKSKSEFYEELTNWIDNKDFKSISQYILNIISLVPDYENSDLVLYKVYGYVIDIFINIYKVKLAKTKLMKEYQMAQDRLNSLTNLNLVIYFRRVVLLTKILTLISIKEKLIKGKNFYIIVEPEDIVQYETIELSICEIGLRHYQVLKTARICGIDDLKHLSLFKLERDILDQDKIKELYFHNWLYHASFSPIWFNRIKRYRGWVDYRKQQIQFVDDDVLDLFYKKYGYEPDEQNQITTDKCLHINTNTNINWTTFHNKFKTNNLFLLDADELEEINNDKIKY
jgi:hypothetical protein